jgi:diacylglycerol kinase (ATP)
MRACTILNPRAGSAGEVEALRSALCELGDVTIRSTEQAGDATRFARAALEEGFDLIIAAGGDGTINEVVNGLSDDWGRATFGIIPMGTGNDFCRTICSDNDPQRAVEILRRGVTSPCDVVCVESSMVRYLINVSAGGFSGVVNEHLTEELKASWGPLAYLRSALAALPDITNYRTTIQFDDEEPSAVNVYNIVVANARYVAGGIPIAPHARIDDGLLDVVIVPVLPWPRLAVLAPLIMLGRHDDSEEITCRRARKVRVESVPGMWFNADGELVGNEPTTFTVLPGVLRVIVGPEFDASSRK